MAGERMAAASNLRERHAEVLSRIGDAAKRSGRRASDVVLVAVTKYAEPEQIREMIALGQRDFGENRVQQLAQRHAMAQEWLARGRSISVAQGGSAPPPESLPESVRWHMIGRLQRNKVRRAVECARLIHSVDSLRIAEEVQNAAVKRETPVEILLQVNCSGESQKGGIAAPAALHLAVQIDTMVNVSLRGVMTMAALDADSAEVRATFERCRDVFEEMKKEGVGAEHGKFNILSMGMTSDFEIAIEEGANMVRIGTALFGPPPEGMEDRDEED